MAIATYASLRAKINSPFQRIRSGQTGFSLTTTPPVNTNFFGLLFSHWNVDTQGPSFGAVPTTAVAPTRATTGALAQQNSSGVLRYGQVTKTIGFTGGNGGNGTWIMADRLSHQGGLSGTSVATQTTNLPTAALTRYTSGVGVMAALEIYTAIGTAATTVTCSYTNEAGTAGRTSIATAWGGTTDSAQGEMTPIPLQSGDAGVRAVASVTAAASTTVVGNFGVTLYKPLVAVPALMLARCEQDVVIGMNGVIPQIITDACLFWISVLVDPGERVTTVPTNSGRSQVIHTFIEE